MSMTCCSLATIPACKEHASIAQNCKLGTAITICSSANPFPVALLTGVCDFLLHAHELASAMIHLGCCWAAVDHGSASWFLNFLNPLLWPVCSGCGSQCLHCSNQNDIVFFSWIGACAACLRVWLVADNARTNRVAAACLCDCQLAGLLHTLIIPCLFQDQPSSGAPSTADIGNTLGTNDGNL